MTEMYISFPIVHISFIITPLYNFIDDSYFAKMPALRQIWNPEHFYSCSRQICHRRKAKASLSAFRFLCGCASCNCIKTRMFSAHSNIFLYSICMNKKSGIYWNHSLPVWFNGAFSCHAQKICSCSGNMVLKKSLLVQESFSGVVT